MMRSVTKDIRHLGFPAWVTYSIDRGLQRLSRGNASMKALWFYAQPVILIPQLPPRDGDRIGTKVLRPGDIPDTAFSRPPDAIRQRFAQGGVCIAAMQDTQLAGFMWLQFDALHERLVRCDFVPSPVGEAAWDYDLYIAPKFRLGRTFGRLWDHAKRLLEERHITTTISWISFDNVGSQRAHERMGARRVGWALILTLWKLEFVVTSSQPRVTVTLDPRRTRIVVDSKWLDDLERITRGS